MRKKFYLINFVLILITTFLSFETYEEWTNREPRGTEASDFKPKMVPIPVKVFPPGKNEKAPPTAFKSISEKNIFNPDRKEFPILLPPPGTSKPQAPPARPNVTLFGVVSGEGYLSALVNNPVRRADKGERETMTVQVGEKVGEYKVTNISEDRITLATEWDSFEVWLYDPAKPKTRPMVVPPAAAASSTPTPAARIAPTPIPPPASTTPPQHYTPPARATLPQGTMRGPQIQRRTIPSPRAVPQPDPDTDEEEDDD